jgi:ATP-dependent RNA helicase RhlE
MKNIPTTPSATFNNLGIAPKLLEILAQNKFVTPTPIQVQSIPVAIQGKDLMGIAQTGTGKTLAFGIPMLQLLAQNKGKKGLVLLPTRELALQVDESLRKIGGKIGLKTAVLIGGESMTKQFRMLKNDPHVIVATPGRLNDHLENKRLSLGNVCVAVLDEADHMLDMGFAPQIKKIMDRVPKQRQTMLFSATMPEEIISLASTYMRTPLRVEVTPPGTTVKTVVQELFFVDRNRKNDLLKSTLGESKGSVLVFTRTKFKARDVTRYLKQLGITAAEIHSNRSQGQRKEALDGFKLGKYRVLVATDIAARGIDVKGIELVLNYDLPATADDYVHRIGRTGRAGMQGRAISFATPDQRREVSQIERVIKQTLKKQSHSMSGGEPLMPERTVGRPQPRPSRPYRAPHGKPHPSRPRAYLGPQRPDRPDRPPRKFSGKPNRRDKFSREEDRHKQVKPRPWSNRHANTDGGGYFMTRG